MQVNQAEENASNRRCKRQTVTPIKRCACMGMQKGRVCRKAESLGSSQKGEVSSSVRSLSPHTSLWLSSHYRSSICSLAELLVSILVLHIASSSLPQPNSIRPHETMLPCLASIIIVVKRDHASISSQLNTNCRDLHS